MTERAAREASREARASDPWTAHEDAQRRAWLRTTHRQRLLWLEQAKRFAAAAIAAARKR